jgi:hypothetical protein
MKVKEKMLEDQNENIFKLKREVQEKVHTLHIFEYIDGQAAAMEGLTKDFEAKRRGDFDEISALRKGVARLESVVETQEAEAASLAKALKKAGKALKAKESEVQRLIQEVDTAQTLANSRISAKEKEMLAMVQRKEAEVREMAEDLLRAQTQLDQIPTLQREAQGYRDRLGEAEEELRFLLKAMGKQKRNAEGNLRRLEATLQQTLSQLHRSHPDSP